MSLTNEEAQALGTIGRKKHFARLYEEKRLQLEASLREIAEHGGDEESNPVVLKLKKERDFFKKMLYYTTFVIDEPGKVNSS